MHQHNLSTAIRLGDLLPKADLTFPVAKPRVLLPSELWHFFRRVVDDLPIVNRLDWAIPARVHVYRNHLRGKAALRIEHLLFLFAGPEAQSAYLEALAAGHFKTFDCAAHDLLESTTRKLPVNPMVDEIEQLLAVRLLPDLTVGGTRYFTSDDALFLWFWLEFPSQMAYIGQLMRERNCGWLDLIPGAVQFGEQESASTDMHLLPLAGSTLSEEVFTHSEDYASVRLRGTTYTLTTKQRAVVANLHINFTEGTPELSWEMLKDSAGIGEHVRRRDFFRHFVGSLELIVPGTRKGTYRLNI